MRSPIFIVYYDLGLGGVQRKIIDIVNYVGQKKPNIDVYILLRRKAKFSFSDEIKNKRVQIIYYLDWLPVKIPFFFPVFVLIKTLELKPRAILAFSDMPALSSIWAKLLFPSREMRVVVSEDRHTSKSISEYPYARVRSFLIKTFYPFADAIFTMTKSTRDSLINNYSISSDKVRVIRNWTAFVHLKPTNIRKDYDIIFIGRLDKEKNLTFLLRGIERLKKNKKGIRLGLIGRGEQEIFLKDYVGRHNLEVNVLFLGARRDVAKHLKRAKVFALTSETEALPLTVLEAMALGLPVISSNYPGVKELIQEGKTGIIYKDLNDFEKKTTRLLSEPKLSNRIGKAARNYVGKYHSPKNMIEYLKALKI